MMSEKNQIQIAETNHSIMVIQMSKQSVKIQAKRKIKTWIMN